MHVSVELLGKLTVAEQATVLLPSLVHMLNVLVSIADLSEVFAAPVRAWVWLIYGRVRAQVVVELGEAPEPRCLAAIEAAGVQVVLLGCRLGLQKVINLEILGRRNIAFVVNGSRVEAAAFDHPHLPVGLDLRLAE